MSEEPERKKPGPKPWEPTEHELGQIKAHAANGVPKKVICSILGRHCHAIVNNAAADEAYEAGKATALGLLAKTAYRTALGIDKNGQQSQKPEVRLLEYLCKTQLGWTEKSTIEHTGADGKPIEYRNLSDEEIDARLAALLGDDGEAAQTTH